MDKDIEKKFVENFIQKRYRDRLLFELNSPKKRVDFLSRFCHNADEIIDPNKIVLKGKKIDTDIEKELKQHKINDEVYVLSFKYSQGQSLGLQEALDYCEEENMPVIIILSDDLALIKTEVEFGAPLKLLLSKK